MQARKVSYDNEKDFRFKLNTKNKKVNNLVKQSIITEFIFNEVLAYSILIESDPSQNTWMLL